MYYVQLYICLRTWEPLPLQKLTPHVAPKSTEGLEVALVVNEITEVALNERSSPSDDVNTENIN